MKKNFIIAAVVLLAWAWSTQAASKVAEEHVTVGVLARDGRSKALKQWAATAEYLTAYINRPVDIVPLPFQDILPAVEKEQVDFFIINPSLFITAKVKYDAAPVLTMKTAGNDRFGAVIFTAMANITDIDSLQGKKFGAVEKSSLGGWQMAQKEFADAGIDIYRHLSTIRFFETHSAVVKAVRSRLVHAGTVRTGTLEEMAGQGEVTMEDFIILERKEYPGFPFAVSTALYPEWILARTVSTDIELADNVATALKYLTKGAKAAAAAQYTGWADPGDYSSVEELQKQLKAGVYKEKKVRK